MADFVAQANAAMVDEDFEEAVKFYSKVGLLQTSNFMRSIHHVEILHAI